MKTTRNISKTVLAMLLVLGSAAFYSCSNDDNNSSNTEEKDAVDAITYSLQSDSNGLAGQVTTASTYAADQNLYGRAASLECGQLYSTTYSETHTGAYSYDYTVSRSTQLTCTTDSAPSSLAYSGNWDGTYDTPRMSSDDSASSSWAVTGLESTSANAIFNGSYTRNGTQVSKVRNHNTFASTLTYALNAINVSKSTHQIVSGAATVAFTGVSSTGNTYTYNGSITFNGDATATLVINGNTYTINL